MTRANETVVFIGGAGHSGSTLLGLCLGSHSKAFYAGEAKKSQHFGNTQKPLRKRMCKVCGPECPVWNHLAGSADDDLYERLSRTTAKPTIVDSTKAMDWLGEQVRRLRGGPALHFVFLGRDGRAVVASGLRKEAARSVEEHVLAWRSQIEATESFTREFPGRVHHVRYEHLATAPETVLRQLADELGLAFEPAMLTPFATKHHPLGGNAGTQSLLDGAQTRVGGPLAIDGAKEHYYASHPRAFRLDERWRSELSTEARETFERLAGTTNSRFAYDASPDRDRD